MIEMVRVYSPTKKFVGKRFFVLVEKFSHIYQKNILARLLEVKNPDVRAEIVKETDEFLH